MVGTVGQFMAPIWPVHLIVLVGSAMLLAVFLMRTLCLAIRAWNGATADPDRSGGGRVMSGIEIGLASLAALLILIYAGLHVSIALALVSFFGIWALRDNPDHAARILSLAARESISSYLFGVVPLFVLMGLVVSRADIGRDTFDVANRVFHRLRGGLGMATVGANSVFAAITGISIASAAVFAKVAVPEMVRIGYTRRFAAGVVAGSSILGMMIPPSLLLILYGIIAEQSVGRLFIAGIMPGLLLAFAFCVGIYLMARFTPGFTGAPAPQEARKISLLAMIGDSSVKLVPIVLLVGLVLGGIYGGIFTPTEGRRHRGARPPILIAVAKRRMGPRTLWGVTLETGHITAAICFSDHRCDDVFAHAGVVGPCRPS